MTTAPAVTSDLTHHDALRPCVCSTRWTPHLREAAHPDAGACTVPLCECGGYTPSYTSAEVLALTKVPYRWLDHACRAGYLPNNTAHGTGSSRRFTEAEIDTVYAARSLIDAGFSYAPAWRIAAQLIDTDEPYRVTAGSIYEIQVQLRPVHHADPEPSNPEGGSA